MNNEGSKNKCGWLLKNMKASIRALIKFLTGSYTPVSLWRGHIA